jgi:hypothetical protein
VPPPSRIRGPTSSSPDWVCRWGRRPRGRESSRWPASSASEATVPPASRQDQGSWRPCGLSIAWKAGRSSARTLRISSSVRGLPVAAGETAGEGARDEERQIASGADDGQPAVGLEIGATYVTGRQCRPAGRLHGPPGAVYRKAPRHSHRSYSGVSATLRGAVPGGGGAVRDPLPVFWPARAPPRRPSWPAGRPSPSRMRRAGCP